MQPTSQHAFYCSHRFMWLGADLLRQRDRFGQCLALNIPEFGKIPPERGLFRGFARKSAPRT